MLRVVIHVSLPEKGLERDLEVPAEVGAEKLSGMIAKALGWSHDEADSEGGYRLAVHPSGTVLEGDTTLAEAGLWDGTHLVLTRPRDVSVEESPLALLESGRGGTYILDHREMIIGRGSSRGDLQDYEGLVDLDQEPLSQTVSREHARIAYGEDQWVLIPSAAAMNPTMVNGQLVAAGEMRPLRDGDVVQLAGVRLVFCADRTPAEPPSRPEG